REGRGVEVDESPGYGRTTGTRAGTAGTGSQTGTTQSADQNGRGLTRPWDEDRLAARDQPGEVQPLHVRTGQRTTGGGQHVDDPGPLRDRHQPGAGPPPTAL